MRTVSIVDDDLSFREALAGLVGALGFPVAAFDSADAFLESEALNRTSCLILDVNMPGLGGWALHDRLNALDLRAPTIFVSAAADRHTRAAALSRGAVGYLDKPVDPDELLLLIQTSILSSHPPARTLHDHCPASLEAASR
jgi:FixJ family two-component response regulator